MIEYFRLLSNVEETIFLVVHRPSHVNQHFYEEEYCHYLYQYTAITKSKISN
jgi:hypothetical protein